METIIFWINLASAIAALIAAALWYKSASIRIEYRGGGGTVVRDDKYGMVDMMQTAAAAVPWNKKAAIAASFAAFLQASSIAVPVFKDQIITTQPSHAQPHE